MDEAKTTLQLDLQAIGKRLKDLRGERPLLEIEALSGCSKSNIDRCEKGLQDPATKLLAFYRFEGVSSDLILYESRKTQAENYQTARLLGLGLPPELRVELARELLNSKS